MERKVGESPIVLAAMVPAEDRTASFLAAIHVPRRRARPNVFMECFPGLEHL
jgi:hypothetical protein